MTKAKGADSSVVQGRELAWIILVLFSAGVRVNFLPTSPSGHSILTYPEPTVVTGTMFCSDWAMGLEYPSSFQF